MKRCASSGSTAASAMSQMNGKMLQSSIDEHGPKTSRLLMAMIILSDTVFNCLDAGVRVRSLEERYDRKDGHVE